jgi:hypothetical protein
LSNKNNINTDHYKARGRGRPGDGVVHEEHKRLRSRIKSLRRRGLSAKQLLERKRRAKVPADIARMVGV